MESCDVAVIGGGSAGLMAAAAAAQAGARVEVFERLPGPGRKLCATGGGRCNLTRHAAAEEIMAAFGKRGRFMAPALEKLDPPGICRYFAGLGVPTASEDGVHVFAASGRAEDVANALQKDCLKRNVRVRTGERVTSLLIEDGAIRGLEARGRRIRARAVILAAGGCSHPALGSDGSGHALARQAGHEIAEATPALVPLLAAEPWVGTLAGIVLPVRLWIRDSRPGGRRVTEGPMLFTHSGISGPATLDISGDVAVALQNGDVTLCAQVAPGLDAGAWSARLEETAQKDGGRRTLRATLAMWMPARLADTLLDRERMNGNMRLAGLSHANRDRLAALLGALPLKIRGAGGWARAMVTRGGVRLKEVRPETLESRLVRGLHLAGEILDLDGPCGGYNLTWAFASGRLAGCSAGHRPGDG